MHNYRSLPLYRRGTVVPVRVRAVKPEVIPDYVPEAVRQAAKLLKIGAVFAYDLWMDGRLPGMHKRDGVYVADENEIYAELNEMPADIREAQRSTISKEHQGPVELGLTLEDYTRWMFSHHRCMTCGYDGIFGQDDSRVYCK